MWRSYLGTVAAERKHQLKHSHFISPVIASSIARWDRLRKDPLFVLFFVWAFLFLLAAVIFAKV